MSSESIESANHIDDVDGKENGSKSVLSCDSGVETLDSGLDALATQPSSETPPRKPDNPVDLDVCVADEISSDLSTPTSLCSDKGNCFLNFEDKDDATDKVASITEDLNTESGMSSDNLTEGIKKSLYKNNNNALATSTVSLNEPNITESNINNTISRSAENICILIVDNESTTSSTKELDKDKILSEFSSQKSKVSATQKIVPENPQTLDVRYSRLPKDILAPDLGSIVKNVHGIFSSVSGSLKNAYINSHRVSQKPQIKNVKPIANGKIMSDIFEDASDEKLNESILDKTPVESNSNSMESVAKVSNEEEIEPKNEMFRLQIESLERVLFEQRKENMSLRERVKQQVDELQAKDQTFKDLETKVDLMCKRAEQAQKEKDAAVMRYASTECAAIEAKKAAEAATKTERAAVAERDLLNAKLKTARDEKQRICQLYDDKCHELQSSEREVARVREELREVEGRLKWTQSKLRMEMDASKESTERAEKLSQQLAEMEAAREAAIANCADTARVKQLETELKESQADLILSRHEKEELDRRLGAALQQLDSCRREANEAVASLAESNKQVESLKESNVRLEEEAAELAALRAQAALADTLSAQLQRYSTAVYHTCNDVRLEEEAAELAALRAQAALADTLSAQLQRYSTAVYHTCNDVRLEEEAAELAALRAQAALADTLSAQLQRYSTAVYHTCNDVRLEEEAAELAALRAQAALADTLSAQLQRETERACHAEQALSAERARAETCSRREAGALEHAARLTAQHVASRACASEHEAKAQALAADNASLREQIEALESEAERLKAALAEETERRYKENRVLARKVAELTGEAAEANKKLEWEAGENSVLKKKHASAIKELNRELQRALKRIEQLESKLPQNDSASNRTGSVSSLSSGETPPQEEKLQNGHAHGDAPPDVQGREPDRQALVERIVSLQRAAAARAERCEFLQEHCAQLTRELRAKSRLLRALLPALPPAALASATADEHKKEIARLGGGAMAAVWGGDPGGMTLELSLEMNRRLQAVLEDTLLKNITLKENMDTLGEEISKLREQKNDDKK
ncbi:coiled-coil domain-containing protein 186 [Bicyclus anynana]|uniref:Coiled-coil domain-containing protein 186 n=1 Tax=Bicyclus anynana TaxID=110368 RepID=A0ABM3M1R1_BICAN|nr:coiled-coil domain-containing protein 186 [Bicyclus anynana]